MLTVSANASAPIMRQSIHRLSSKALTVIYGLIGLYFICTTSIRIWQEGLLGNETHVFFVTMEGPVILSLKFLAALSLTAGQVMKLLGKSFGFWLSRASFFLVVITLVTYYLILRQGYIWSYAFDFVISFSLAIAFYLPIVLRDRSNPKWNTLKYYKAR
jgi:hypothetical protein